MAEYYPLLAKAVGSLPNSTPDSRRVVYERARKALIGQLRTLHPPVPEEDIERESVALDRAVERLEAELANGGIPAPAAPPEAPKPPPPAPKPAPPKPASTLSSDTGGFVERRPPPLKTKLPKPPVKAKPPAIPDVPPPPPPGPRTSQDARPPVDVPQAAEIAPPPPAPTLAPPPPAPTLAPPPGPPEVRRPKPGREPQRPIAPQPPVAKGPKRRIWIIPAGIGIVVVLVALAAWKLRDRPEAVVRTIRPSDQQQADAGKIAERVGGSPSSSTSDDKPDAAPEPPHAATPDSTPTTTAQQPAQQQTQQPAANPAVPVAHRAALLVEAPDEPNKVKTYLGTVVWKLNNVSQGQNDAVGLAVEADIDLPDDKLKAVVTFEKNSDASLPASHTIKIRFLPESGSPTGDIKQISVPQMRPEANPSGEPLAGVTVPVVQNSFLVGLSPGNAETANTDLIKRLQWIDVPMLLDSGKIAKLTFEKNDSGQRDLTEAFDAWQKP